MSLIVISIGCVDIMNSWLMSELLSIVESIWIGGLELESVVPWLLIFTSVLCLLIQTRFLPVRNLDLRIFIDVFRLSRVLVANLVGSLVDMGIYIFPSWLIVEIISIELIVIY
jgi:hypothetical protein